MNADTARRLVQGKLTLYRKSMDIRALKDIISRVQEMQTEEQAEPFIMSVILRSSGPKITQEMYEGLVGTLQSANANIFMASFIQPLDDTAPLFTLRDKQLTWATTTIGCTPDAIHLAARVRLELLRKSLCRYMAAPPHDNTTSMPLFSALGACKYLPNLVLVENSAAPRVVVVGMLHDKMEGLQLEDENTTIGLSVGKSVYCDVSEMAISPPNGCTEFSLPLFDQAVVAVMGRVVDGSLAADAIFTPPVGDPDAFNTAVGANKLPISAQLYTTLPTDTPDFGLIFSHMLLSDQECVQDFLSMLGDYNENVYPEYIPSHIVISGPFHSATRPMLTDVLDTLTSFLDILVGRNLQNVCRHTVFTFIPNTADPSITGNVYPRQLCSEDMAKELCSRYKDLKLCFPTTPLRLVYGHQTLIVSSMPHEAALLKAVKSSTLMQDLDGYSVTHEEIAKLMVNQMHVLPVPFNVVPRMWNLDSLLNIVPMPNSIVLCDGKNAQQSLVSGVTVLSPGCFYIDRTYASFAAARTECPVKIMQLSRPENE